MPNLVTKSAYARHRGVSAPAVTKAISRGRLVRSVVQGVGPNGKPCEMIDLELADAEWERNTSPAKMAEQGQPTGRARQPAADRPAVDDPDDRNGDGGEADELLLESGRTLSVAAAEAILKTYKARQAKLEYLEAAGQLVPIAAVAKAVAAEYENVRARLLGLPTRYCQELAITTDQSQVRAILERAINDALAELVGNVGTGGPGAAAA